MRFCKYHALGNDYIVLDPRDLPQWAEPSVENIRMICHRHFGVGSDGILWGPLPSSAGKAFCALRIFNPDGSEAEKSGNGLRIFSRYLHDHKLLESDTFSIETAGGIVESTIKENGRLITVDMGQVSFASEKIPVSGPARDVINETLRIADRDFLYCAATIGNPHCVIPLDEVSPDIAHQYGSFIESHQDFPNKINVQFMKILDRENIRIEIWERGAGYTLASGSSASASAAVAHKLGLVSSNVTVHMPGGNIFIEISSDFSIRMSGTVNKVAEGDIDPDLFTFTLPS